MRLFRKSKGTKKPDPKADEPCLLLPTGSALLNLACAESPFGGYGPGRMVNIIGDSFSGKTVLALTCLAELANNKRFDSYRLIYDDAEMASGSFDFDKLFGKRFRERIEPPNTDEDGTPLYSTTVEDFHGNLNRLIKEGNPFVYVLDSFDAISDESEISKSEESLKARQTGKPVSGSYNMYKQKYASQMFRLITSGLSKTKSLLIVVSQTRDRITTMGFGNPKTRSGGNALKFYSSHEMWLSYIKSHKNPKTKRTFGARTKIKITKNKITGKLRECEIDIYSDYGIDDIGSCIDFMVEEGFWKKSGAYINAVLTGKEKRALKADLIHWIENENLERRLFDAVAEGWMAIEEKMKLNRKSRFS